MVGLKSMQARVVGIKTDEVHLYILLSTNRVSIKKTDFLALQSLLTSSVYLVAFYTCDIIMILVGTKCLQQG